MEITDDRGGAARIAAELDAVHEQARQAYARRDATAYLATLHPELTYTQADGRTIDREQLARDVRTQLARVHAATTEFRRESLAVDGDAAASEVLEQRATFEVRAFGVIHRAWTVHRRGRYGWVQVADRWQLRRVEVLTEEVSPPRSWVGFGRGTRPVSS